VPSGLDDLFGKFLALGYVSPDDLKEMRERSAALGSRWRRPPSLRTGSTPMRAHGCSRRRSGFRFSRSNPTPFPAISPKLFPEALAARTGSFRSPGKGTG